VKFRGQKKLALSETVHKTPKVAALITKLSGRPLGTAEFIGALEQQTQRHLAPQRRGRPRKTTVDERQIDLSFAP